MKIGFIGAGKVGCTLGLYLGKKNEIVGYMSRSADSADFAANLTNSETFDESLKLFGLCDMVYITTPDAEIGPTWSHIVEQARSSGALEGKIVAHASGSFSSSELKDADKLGAYAISTHPLFAIPSKTETAKELHKALIVIEGSEEKIDEVAQMFSEAGNEVQTIPTEEKTRYHAAAVLASNHVVALYHIALKQLVECGFETKRAQEALNPLFLGNALHIAEEGPIESLTGPAERNDVKTVNKHLEVLQGRAKSVYELLNQEALEIAEEKREREK